MGLFDSLGDFTSVLNTGINAFSAVSGYNSAQSASSLANQAFNTVAGSTAEQDQIAQEQWNLYKQNDVPNQTTQANIESQVLAGYTPDVINQQWSNYNAQQALQPQYIADQQQLLDQANRSANDWGQQFATQAHTDVQNSFDQQRQQSGRALDRMGIDPTSGRSITALQSGMGVNQSLADVAGQQTALNQGYDTAWNRQAGIQSLAQGNQVPQQQGSDGSTLVNQALTGLSGSNTANNNLVNSELSSAAAAGKATGAATSALTGTGSGSLAKGASSLLNGYT